MEGRPLSHLELMTLSLKDEQYYRDWIEDDLQAMAQRFFGVRRWIQLRNAITVLSRFGYFAATNVSTLGEEFCEARVEKSSMLKRLLMVALNNELQLPKEFPRSYARLIKDAHLVTFFLFGDFYELCKRASNYSYLTNDTTLYQSKRLNLLYRLVGCMSLTKLLVDIVKETQQEQKQKPSNTQPIESKESKPDLNKSLAKPRNTLDPSSLCHLCSETRTEPTSALCGHIFCWDCIHRWLRERNECPICRSTTEPSRLIHLINFK